MVPSGTRRVLNQRLGRWVPGEQHPAYQVALVCCPAVLEGPEVRGKGQGGPKVEEAVAH